MNKQELICINCPIGCHLEVTKTDQGLKVSGNQCKRGEIYAVNEITAPSRVLTSTVRVNSSFLRRLPVRTNKPIPKSMIFQAMEIIDKIVVNTPITIGDVITDNLMRTGVDLIASRSLSE
ncbi:MAG TPA: DUF1667 domain-containing protein [Clostridiales bacterium]|jgi:CxxC motif-containing protein|nr:DUF1667 domain-containing protein [Clostridiales bacterium]